MVESMQQVDDIRAEWLDRYGPIPDPAEMLLQVGRVRAECHRLGATEVVVTRSDARLSPLTLKVSDTMRLSRVAKDAIYKDTLQQLIVPVPRTHEPVEYLLEFLSRLFPVADN